MMVLKEKEAGIAESAGDGSAPIDLSPLRAVSNAAGQRRAVGSGEIRIPISGSVRCTNEYGGGRGPVSRSA